MTGRYTKIVMTTGLACYALLITVTNIANPAGNRPFVMHVMSMDTTFRDPAVAGRAITNPGIWRLAYVMIVGGEALTGLLLAAAAIRLLAVRSASSIVFNRAKSLVHLGVLSAFTVWFFGFITIGGEWFLMWQSAAWNGQEAAFRISTMTMLVLIYISQPDCDIV